MILNASPTLTAANRLTASALSQSASASIELKQTNGMPNRPSPSVIISLSTSAAGMSNVSGQQLSSSERISSVYAKPEAVLTGTVSRSINGSSLSEAEFQESGAQAKKTADSSLSEDEEQELPSSRNSTASVDSAGTLSEQEMQIVEELKARDREVRAHEQAHKAVGGQYAGAISFSYQSGPDGRRYAVGGEVPIDVSPVPGDPQATIAKMTIVRSAATAPAQPSSQDVMVAAEASRKLMEAQNELMLENNVQLKISEKSSESETETGTTNENSDVEASVTNNNNDSRLDVFQFISGMDTEIESKVDILI